jgi:hypothetical protein
MEGLAASVVLIAILLVVGGLVYLLAQRLPKRSPEPPRKPANRWIGVGWIVLTLLIIGLWAGVKSANPQPPGGVQPACPAGPMWAPLQGLCQQLCGAGYPSGGIVGRAALAVSRPLPSLRPDSQASMAAGGPVTSTGGLVPMCSMP